VASHASAINHASLHRLSVSAISAMSNHLRSLPEYSLLTSEQRSALIAHGNHIRSLDPTQYAQKILIGKSPPIACAADPRASFTVYTPAHHSFDGSGPELPVVVSIHGTLRDARLIDKMGPFAEQYGCIVIAPLFPCGIVDVSGTLPSYLDRSLVLKSNLDIHNYKHLLYHDIRYDLLVLSIVEQVSYTWRVRSEKFYMHGFSGGGQFAHRFLYAHPHRLLGVSIGAPGQVTLPDVSLAWPHGIKDLGSMLEINVDLAQVQTVPVHFVIGEKDTSPLPGGRGGEQTEEEKRTGNTRQDKIRTLRNALRGVGMVGRLVTVPNVGHAGLKCLDPVHDFFGGLVRNEGP
jgi:poly(3-hydroxybutyrate) depolymerase